MLTREDLLAIEGILAPRFDTIDKQFEGVTKRLDTHDKRFDRLEQRLDAHDKRFENLELRMEHLESDMSALKYGQLDLRREIKANYKKIKETYDLALENFGQIEESKTRLSLLEQQF